MQIKTEQYFFKIKLHSPEAVFKVLMSKAKENKTTFSLKKLKRDYENAGLDYLVVELSIGENKIYAVSSTPCSKSKLKTFFPQAKRLFELQVKTNKLLKL